VIVIQEAMLMMRSLTFKFTFDERALNSAVYQG
jgi:hypothetical protein